MMKFFLLAIIGIACAIPDVHQLIINGDSVTGSLLLDNYALFYIDYPENTSSIAVQVTGRGVNSDSSCSTIWTYANPLTFPCADEPDNNLVANDNDACRITSNYGRVSPSSILTGDTATFNFYPGNYFSSKLSSVAVPNQGRLFYSLNKGDASYNCSYTIKATSTNCQNAAQSNNGFAIGSGSSYFNTESTQDLTCGVLYNTITLDGIPYRLPNATAGSYVFKSVIPKNAAYVNFTINGTAVSTSDIDIYLSPKAAFNSSQGGLSCTGDLSFDDGNTDSTTITCYNVPEGNFYATILVPSSDPTNYFNGTISAVVVTCPQGTATGYGYYDQSKAMMCSADNFFNVFTTLFNPTVGKADFTAVPSGTYKTGYFEIPQQLIGATVTINFTSDASAYLSVGQHLNHGVSSNEFSTSSNLDGFTLSPFTTNAQSSFVLNNSTFYVSYYCSSGPCTSSIFVSGFTPAPAGVTSGAAPAGATSGMVMTGGSNSGVTSAMVMTGGSMPMTSGMVMTGGNTNTTANSTITAKATTTTTKATTGGNANTGFAVIPSIAILATIFAALF